MLLRIVAIAFLAGTVPSVVDERGAADRQSTRHQIESSLTPSRDARIAEIRMVKVLRGEFTMGSSESELGRNSDEGPQHWVRIGAFEISDVPVTRGQFAEFARGTGFESPEPCQVPRLSLSGVVWDERKELTWMRPGFEQTDSHPVVCVSWDDAVKFVEWLNLTDATGRKGWRLPTEAEYEFAARSGTTSARYWADSDAPPCRHANVADERARSEAEKTLNALTLAALKARRWFVECDDGYAYTSPVRSFPPNAYGLYDTLGNVWQWVADCYGKRSYLGLEAEDAQTQSCRARAARGGSFADQYGAARSARRGNDQPSGRSINMGFRVARTISP